MSSPNQLDSIVPQAFSRRIHEAIQRFIRTNSHDDHFEEALNGYFLAQLNVVLAHVDRLEERLQNSQADLRASIAAGERQGLSGRRDSYRIQELEEQIEFMRRDRFHHDHLQQVELWQHVFSSLPPLESSADELTFSQAQLNQLEAMRRRHQDDITANSAEWTARESALRRHRQRLDAERRRDEGRHALELLRQRQDAWAFSGNESWLLQEMNNEYETMSDGFEIGEARPEMSTNWSNGNQAGLTTQQNEIRAASETNMLEYALSQASVTDSRDWPDAWNFEIYEDPELREEPPRVPDAGTFHIHEDPDILEETQLQDEAAARIHREGNDENRQPLLTPSGSPMTPSRNPFLQASAIAEERVPDHAITLHRAIAHHDQSVRRPLGVVFAEEDQDNVLGDLGRELERAVIEAQAKAQAGTEAQTQNSKKRKFVSEEETRVREYVVEISNQLDSASEERPAKRRKLEHTCEEDEEWYVVATLADFANSCRS